MSRRRRLKAIERPRPERIDAARPRGRDPRYEERGRPPRPWLEPALRAAAIAFTPGAREALDRQVRYEQAMVSLVAIVGPTLANDYVAEAERRVAFARRLDLETPTGPRDPVAIVEAMLDEVKAGVL